MKDVVSLKEPEFCERLYMYIKNNPSRCDAVFAVGPQKEIIKTLKAVLEVSSPIFQKLFEDSWDHFLDEREDEDEGIPLADVDPCAFNTFLKLLLTNDVSVDTLITMKFSAEDLLNMIEICQRFGVNKIHQNLVKLAEQTLFSNLTRFLQSDEFFDLSQKNVKIILSRDEISMEETDIFDIATKWSELQCDKAGKKKSLENIRRQLGDCLFEIRFPIMAYHDFGKVIRSKNILTSDEQIEIFKYLSLDETELINFDTKTVGFKTKKRSMLYGPMVSLLKLFKISPIPFICDGQIHSTYFQSDRRVSLTCFGFLGPLEGDSFYECHVDILRYNPNYSNFTCGQVTRRVFARKKEIFYLKLDDAIIIDPTYTSKTNWNNYYGIRFSLKGPKTQSLDLGKVTGADDKSPRHFWVEADRVGFYCQWNNNPLVELQFKKTS